MPLCFLTRKHSEFSPSLSGYFKNDYNYFASIFQICICSAFFLMCEMLSKKRNLYDKCGLCFLLHWWDAQFPGALWLNFLAEKGMSGGWFGTDSISKKIKETLIEKDNRTSCSHIYSVRDSIEGICVIYNSWIVLL